MYIFMITAASFVGYKHIYKAKLKIFKYKSNYTVYGITHTDTDTARLLVSK